MILPSLAILLLCAVAAGFAPRGGKPARPWLPLGLLILASGPVLFLFFRGAAKGFFPFDDSYLSLSAAENLAEHFELAVVRGHPLQGVTSPLHVILVGFLGSAIGVERAARLISLISFLAACFGAGRIAQEATGDRRAFFPAAGLCLFSGAMLYDIGNGMETSLFTALLIWSFHYAGKIPESRRGAGVAGILCGLSMLTRPEGLFCFAAIFVAPLVVAAIRRDFSGVKNIALGGAVALALYTPALIANLVFTGHAAATASAKSMFFRKGEMSFPRIGDLKTPFLYFFFSAELVGVAALIGGILRRRYRELLFVLLFYAAYLTRFPDALRHYRTRYQHPLWPLIALGAVLAVYWLVGHVSARWKAKGWPGGKAVVRLIPALLAGVLLFATMYSATFYHRVFLLDTKQTGRFLMPMVKAVRENTRPGQLVAAHDVGVLIHRGERPILDLVGLTDRSVADRLAAGRVGTAAIGPILFERRPALLVLLRRWEEEFLELTRHVPEGTYTLIWSSRPNAATGARYDIYRCNW